MAKKKRKNKRAAVVPPREYTEYKTENGVEVALHDNNRGPDHLWLDDEKARQEDIVLEQVQASIHIGKKVKRARRMDALQRLYDAKLIDDRAHDAGYRFQSDFYMGHLSGYPSPKFEYTPAVTGESDGAFATEAARARIAKAIEYLGGADSAHAKAVWDFIGLQASISSHAISHSGHGHATWTGVLVMAIERLADYYFGNDKKNIDSHRK